MDINLVLGGTVKMKPDQAQFLNKRGYVFRWLDKEEGHKDGQPEVRRYQYIGKYETKP